MYSLKGVGLGAVGVLFSDIVKNTNLDERSSILSIIMVGRQFGMVIGPALNLIFLNLDFKIGPFSVDSLTAPGV
jgi:MFS family permease